MFQRKLYTSQISKICQCLNVQLKVENENRHRHGDGHGHGHGHGDEDVGDAHEQLHILLHYH